MSNQNEKRKAAAILCARIVRRDKKGIVQPLVHKT